MTTFFPDTDQIPANDLTGRRFGYLEVLGYAGYFRSGKFQVKQHAWRCRCHCGTTKVIRGGALGVRTNSCGCMRPLSCAAANRTHGQSDSLTHRVWRGMKTRCYNPRRREYKDYGGRGIKVCDRWLDSFASFVADMGECPAGCSIERIENDRDYEPGNCVWAGRRQQNRNRRNVTFLELDGVRRPMVEWAELLGISPKTLRDRVNRGWDDRRVLTEPVRDRSG